jgi:drug/metabolite transporter (DMT)-like permease
MFAKYKHQLILHIIVLIWGLTGILGDYINLSSSKIVFFRTLIAFVSLIFIGLFIKQSKKLTLNQILKISGVGIIVGLHWFTFFYSIKVSTISIGVVCMSLTTLFVALIEPIIFKRKISKAEIFISIFILVGIIIIFGFEFKYVKGILFGVFSALMAAIFSVFNGELIKTVSSFSITKYEMLGAVMVSSLIMLFSNEFDSSLFVMSNNDLILLLFLGLVCTTVAFMISVWVMKFLGAFTVSVSVNMEPIYTIIIAVLLAPEKEKMTYGFYIGGAVIIGAIFTNAYLKRKGKG